VVNIHGLFAGNVWTDTRTLDWSPEIYFWELSFDDRENRFSLQKAITETPARQVHAPDRRMGTQKAAQYSRRSPLLTQVRLRG
jgi:hypothetical protein